MGRKPRFGEQEAFLSYLRSGKYEMNLLEHSFSGANKNPDRDSASVVFREVESHPETGEPVERTWEMTFSSKFGRPTPKDDDVFMALTKLSKAMEFSSEVVPFSSYQVIRILRWDEGGKSYKAIDDAFNRICGVRIVATNYWYDNEAKEYADRKFGLIDDVMLYERDKRDRDLRKAIAEGRERPCSWFRWSDVMHQSFKAGYVTTVDMDECLSIPDPVGRKLYRFLRKRFYKDTRKVRLPLRVLGEEKLGYKIDTPLAELKRRVSGPIGALEERGIFGLRHQFVSSYGKCDVVFERKRTVSRNFANENSESGVVARLTSFGLSREAARRAEKRHKPDRIQEDVEAAEFMQKKGMVKQSLGGLLHRMLESDEPWSRPEGFVSTVEKEKRAKRSREKRRAEAEAKRRQEEREEEERRVIEVEFDRFIESLGGKVEREAFKVESLEAQPMYRRMYEKNIKEGNSDNASTWLREAMKSHWQKTKRRCSSSGEGMLFS